MLRTLGLLLLALLASLTLVACTPAVQETVISEPTFLLFYTDN